MVGLVCYFWGRFWDRFVVSFSVIIWKVALAKFLETREKLTAILTMKVCSIRHIKTIYILIYNEHFKKLKQCGTILHICSHKAITKRLPFAFITSFQFVYCYSIVLFRVVLLRVELFDFLFCILFTVVACDDACTLCAWHDKYFLNKDDESCDRTCKWTIQRWKL